MLLDAFRKQAWCESDFKGESRLFSRIGEYSKINSRSYRQELDKLNANKDSQPTVLQ